MNEPVLLSDKRDGICRLTLNRPQSLNALNRELGDSLIGALEDCAEDDSVRAIVLGGAGRAFCAGDDIRGGSAVMANGSAAPPPRRRGIINSVRASNYFHFAQKFRACPKPIITRIHGLAYGAGMDLMLASDIAIAADDARIAAIFVQHGIIGGTTQLPRFAGIKKGMEMLFTGDPILAPEAQQLGLINYAVPADKLDETVDYWAAKIAAGPTTILSNIKFAAYRGLDMTFADSWILAAMATAEAGRTEDAQEGRASFREKRPAVFSGL